MGQTGYSVTKLSTSDTYIIFLYQFILKQLFLLEAVQACVQLRLVKNGPDSAIELTGPFTEKIPDYRSVIIIFLVLTPNGVFSVYQ